MNIERFGVEEWMDKYESDAKYNITDTCARPMTLKELFALAGEDREDFVEALFEKEQSYGSIYGLASLKEEIAGLYETITPDDILTQHGATGGNQHVLFSLVRPGDRVVAFSPSYQQFYSTPRALGANVTVLKLRRSNGFLPDLDELRKAAARGLRLICITNPNNPTGLPLDPGALLTFLERVPEKCVVVLDEAYTDFMDEKLRTPSFEWVKRFPNLLVTRTFSKAYGLAGLRAGFGVANKELIEMMNRIRPPFNMNAAAQTAAVAALEDQAFLRKVVQTNAKERARLAAFFDELKLVQLPSQANFIMVHVGPEAAEINEAMLRKGVILRPLKSYGLPEYMRISVGSPEENDIFMKAFRETLSAL